MAAAKIPADSKEGAQLASRLARRERRRELSRDEILRAARAVLLRSGIAAMTLEAVAQAAGMSKTGLYYYYPSKDALMFELVFGAIERQARSVQAAVRKAGDGGGALRAIIGETVRSFADRLDDFRLIFMFAQVAGAGSVNWSTEQFERLRPLNDLLFADAARLLASERVKRAVPERVEPRLLAFLAYLSAIGLLTMKGMVEQLDDPLIYSDEELIEGFARVFEAAASA
jgi:AcrR family transcriptional regulator